MSQQFEPAPRPVDERERQQAVESLGVLGEESEASGDDLAWLAANACDTPIALVGLMDNERQWFHAICGLPGTEAPRDLTFCGHAMLGEGVFVVEDATKDDRFAGNPFVTGDPHVRFYAGVPLIGRSGYAYGTLCVVDTRPRVLSEQQREALVRLGRQAVKHLEIRTSRNLVRDKRNALADLVEGMPDGLVSCDAAGHVREFNQTARLWHGGIDPRALPPEEWAQYFDLFTADGSRHLLPNEIPLLRAFMGEEVRDAEIMVQARGQPGRSLLCNGNRMVAEDGSTVGAVCVMRDITELRRTEERLRERELQLRTVLDNSYDAFIATDESGKVIDWNPAAEKLFGWTATEARGQELATMIVPPAYREGHNSGMQRYIETGVAHVLNKRLQLPARHRQGHEFPVELTISEVQISGKRVLTAFLHDISKRVETELLLRHSEARLRAIADNSPALIAYVDVEERLQFANHTLGDWCGIEVTDVVGKTVSELRGEDVAVQMRLFMARALAGERVVIDVDIPHGASEVRRCQVTLIPDADGSGHVKGYHVMGYDVTAQRKLTDVMEERALRDELTGLPNRAGWNQELARGLARAEREGRWAAVIFVDLDGFKSINDVHGHAAGDVVLRSFSELLRNTLRTTDIVARLSGDEFVVLLDPMGDVDRAPKRVAEKILEAAAVGARFGNLNLPIRPSVGIGIQRGPGFDAEELVRSADEAMYAAKRSAISKWATRESSVLQLSLDKPITPR